MKEFSHLLDVLPHDIHSKEIFAHEFLHKNLEYNISNERTGMNSSTGNHVPNNDKWKMKQKKKNNAVESLIDTFFIS